MPIIKSQWEFVIIPAPMWYVAKIILKIKLKIESFTVLSIDISRPQNAIVYNLDNTIYLVGAIVVKPFHYDSKYPRQIEFYSVIAFLGRDTEADKNRLKDIFEQFSVYLIHVHYVETFNGKPE